MLFSKERKHDFPKSKRRSRSRSKDRRNSKNHAKEYPKDKITTAKDEDKKETKVDEEIFDPTNRDKVRESEYIIILYCNRWAFR